MLEASDCYAYDAFMFLQSWSNWPKEAIRVYCSLSTVPQPICHNVTVVCVQVVLNSPCTGQTTCELGHSRQELTMHLWTEKDICGRFVSSKFLIFSLLQGVARQYIGS